MNALPLPFQRLGRYDILRELGQGAMGIVYEGRDPQLDRKVAIKTVRVTGLSKEEAQEFEQRFATEARSAGRLQHPNIVSVYDAGRQQDARGSTAYIVMEFVEGRDMKEILDQGQRFTLSQTLSLMADLLAALQYAHTHKIIHRDIKPANLLITPQGRLKLTDFGIARIQDSGEATRTQGNSIGTLKYMSPEQIAGKGVEARSDLFSAGIVLYQLLTGVRPFDGEGYLEIASQIVNLQAKAPTVLSPHLPLALDHVVAKALEKSALRRYADAAQFAAALVQAAQQADLTLVPATRENADWTSPPAAFQGTSPSHSFNASGLQTLPGVSQGMAHELELVYWKDVKDSSNTALLEAFLKRFPDGVYADLARHKLRESVRALATAPQGAAYEATQLSSKLFVAPALSPSVSSHTPAQSKEAAQNDSVFGASTQFAPTQMPDAELSTQLALAQKKPKSKLESQEGKKSAFEKPSRHSSSSSASASKKSSNLSSKQWGILAGVCVVGAGLLFALSQTLRPKTNASEAVTTPAQAPVSAPPQAPTPTVAASSSASPVTNNLPQITTSQNAIVQTQTLSSSLSPTQSSVSPAPMNAGLASATASSSPANLSKTAAIRKPVLTASPLPAKESPQRPMVNAPEIAPAPAASLSAPASTEAAKDIAKPPPAQASPPVLAKPATAPSSPKEACEGRVLIGYLNCLGEQCAKPQWTQHPICVERREMEDRRRQQQLQ